MAVVLGIMGMAVVLATLADALDTLVSTRIRSSHRWPTDLFYRATWRLWRSFAARPGHSWVTGLGVVDDTAILAAACLPGADRGPAMRLHRQSVRTFRRLAARIGLEGQPYEPLTPEVLRIGYDRWPPSTSSWRPVAQVGRGTEMPTPPRLSGP
ncbi:MAG: hypothetical protein ABIS47_09110 [Acidimicrobiales bacterium]